MTGKPLRLEGVTVIIYNGPYATFLLAPAGATVIKIDPPGGESLCRRGVVGGAALPFAMLNRCRWRSLLSAMEREDLSGDPRFASLKDRVAALRNAKVIR